MKFRLFNRWLFDFCQEIWIQNPFKWKASVNFEASMYPFFLKDFYLHVEIF